MDDVLAFPILHLNTSMACMSLASLVFLILTGQVFLYFRRKSVHSRDSLWTKSIVAFIWLIQVLEIALACCMSVLDTQTKPSRHAALAFISIEWSTYIASCATTAFLVHVVFVYRVYLLGKSLKHTRFYIIIGLVTLLEGVLGLISAVFATRIDPTIRSSFGLPINTGFVWLGCSAAADILIAVSLWHILRGSRTGSPRTDLMVKRLAIFCVQTGLITSIAAGITVAIWTVAKLDIGHLFMTFPMGGIYATCLMTNLLARESYLHPRIAYEDTVDIELLGPIVFADPPSIPDKGRRRPSIDSPFSFGESTKHATSTRQEDIRFMVSGFRDFYSSPKFNYH
ncbi:hypothetical protein F5I97DRAFT_1441123 [Phlebopus sp. FC_14]|nr:hypothetical protein F5I97DRAFT_1441123 [Phlebopus sp. FC_14]